ncbi:MAG: AAA family ATPase [Acidimicrobiales bacterium]
MRVGAAGPLGRGDELAHLERLVHDSSTHSQRLLVVGEAGIGKTTLLDRAEMLAREAGHLVLAARPTRAEQRLPFAVLADLVRDLDASVLPDGWRVALDVALGRRHRDGSPPQPHHIGMAVVGLVEAELARGRSVAIVVDDIQWVDVASREPLEFAVRRLPSAGVLVVLAERLEHDQAADTGLVSADEVVRLGPLPVDATEQLVRAAVPDGVSPHVVARVVATAHGNPLFAIEFARSASDAPSEAGRPLPTPTSLASVTATRLAGLPEATQEALTLLSMLARPTVDTMAALGVLDDLRAAELAGVVALSNRSVRFTHPVLASAAYDASTGTERIALHRRLADVTHGTEQLVHRALASPAVNGQLADELLDAASRESARGATYEAADIGALALGLSASDDPRHWSRAVAVGEFAFRAGRTDDAVALLETAERSTDDVQVRAKALLMLATIEYSRVPDSEVAARIARSCLALATDITIRIEAHAILARCDYLDFAEAVRHAEAALTLLAEQPDPDPALYSSVLVAAAAARFNAGLGLDRERLEHAMELERRIDVIGADSAYGTLAALLKYADDVETSIEMFDRLARDADPASVPYALGHLPQLHVWRGDLTTALEVAEHGRRLAIETQQDGQLESAEFNRALIAALRGRYETALEVAVELFDRGRLGDIPWTERMGAGLLGLVAMCRDELDDAVRHFVRYDELGEQMSLHEPGYHRLIGDYIETLVLAGERARAAEVLDRFGARADRAGRVSVQAMVARGRALAAMRADDAEIAMAEARRAVDLVSPTALVYETARAELVLGAVARWARERALARRALTSAIDAFDAMGAQPFAAKARRERDRISGRSRRDDDPTALTASEASVASLAAAGRTTRQIADAMHISVKTVESHLTSVYRKLGVSNRAQLAARHASRLPPVD